ncbi:MAG TPA: cupin domain-containing protein [Nitrososphaerales archaeon]|nr:cupin domain-containing protein [Nitrososphaerales archaeon]
MPVFAKAIKEEGRLVSTPESLQFHSGYVVLEAGKEVGEHETGDGEEMVVFLEGSAEVSYGGESKEVSAPAVAVVPAHTPHNIRNRSSPALRYVYIYNAAAKG